MTKITGQAKLSAVIGWPVAQSKSPLIHNSWLTERKIDGAYLPLPLLPENLAPCVSALKDMGFCGWNVTVPHKESIIPLLDSLTPEAKAIGAVNTVIHQKGKLTGDNTDAFGFIENLYENAVDFLAKDALVLGAGGAARAVLYALIKAGQRKIWLCNRTEKRAQNLATEFNTLAQNEGFDSKVEALPWQNAAFAAKHCSLLVNTSLLGMEGQPPLELELGTLPLSASVNDIVYKPLETPLLAWARARGNKVIDGLGMLLHQARPGFKAWYGGDLPDVNQALRKHVLES